MEITQLYAIATAGFFFCLVLFSYRPYTALLLKNISLLSSQHLAYPRVIHRHRYLGPWSRADVLLQLSYIAVNMFCVGFEASYIRAAGLRAANLSLINLIPAFAGPHLSFLADILRIPLTTYHRIHRSSGIMSCCLLAFHVITVAASPTSRTPLSLRSAENLWAVIVSTFPLLAFFLPRAPPCY